MIKMGKGGRGGGQRYSPKRSSFSAKADSKIDDFPPDRFRVGGRRNDL